MDPFEERVIDYIHRKRLISKGDSVLVAVSGGPDSVALIHLLHRLRAALRIRSLIIIHLNHQLRHRDSDRDALFVANLAAKLRLPLEQSRIDVEQYRKEKRLSVEMAARQCRYRFFHDVSKRLGIYKIAVGHTANDQAEEILLRLFRGTGPGGTAGMKPISTEGIIRPLLFAKKDEILHYLDTHRLSFREDLTNRQPFCQRNVLRLQILPLIERHFHGRLVETLCRFAELASEEERWWRRYLNQLWPHICLAEDPRRMVLDLHDLRALDTAVRRRFLRFAIDRFKGELSGIYHVHIEDIADLIDRGRSGSHVCLPKGLLVFKEFDTITLTWKRDQTSPFSWRIERPGHHHFPPYDLELTIIERPFNSVLATASKKAGIMQLDADALKWPLILRSWQPGDRFQPLGLKGSKKLQDFFTDLKVPRLQRGRIPLLCDQEKICCVLGYRMDERVKVTAETRRLLVVRYRFENESGFAENGLS